MRIRVGVVGPALEKPLVFGAARVARGSAAARTQAEVQARRDKAAEPADVRAGWV